ncbi:baseplate wedge tail fiber protein connector [Acinetobacter phage Acj9]|uniref:Gp9 base plate wedge completion tail fiber socket protein n=1 Tax=Acinetobacter phage Acj9 TaxID=760939 RepID=E5EPV0_9CAUD|nr:baseplate wedge tail fiber protein connector [Acinetobacter phage Acj9]ADG60066.1 gp9 base plate wedge completion tail fiber socket protein [Acinetobacter phage Acj9]
MYVQTPKTEIDVGVIGNGSTGDILFDGGTKLNSLGTNIYNTFGDVRFYDRGTQTQFQTLHAQGYFQKVSAYDFRSPVAMGTLWDVDTQNGAANPTLAEGKPGEYVVFINSNGTCSINNPIVIQATGGSFAGIQGALTVTHPYAKIECWCISNENNVPIWNYKLSSLFGSTETAIEVTRPISATGQTVIPIAHMSQYNSIKLLVTASSADGTKLRQSEVNLLIDTRLKNVHSTEFAVMRVGNANEDDEILDIKYNLSNAEVVQMVVTPTGVANMRVSVKSITTQKIGSA